MMDKYVALEEVLYLARSFRGMMGDTEPDQYLDEAFEIVGNMIDELEEEETE